MNVHVRLLSLCAVSLLAGCQGCDTNPSPVAPDAASSGVQSVLLTSSDLGDDLLGQWSRVPLDPGQTTAPLLSLPGTGWIDFEGSAEVGLTWNEVDHHFYGVLSGAGAHGTAMIISYDPEMRALTMLKTLSLVSKPNVMVNGVSVPFEQPSTYLLRPVFSADGKSMLLRASTGGRLNRGVLTHVNLDPASPRYLDDTIVYDFFDYESAPDAGTCVALYALPEKMAQPLVHDGKLVLGLGGLSWNPDNGTDPTLHGVQCNFTAGPPANSRIPAGMFTLVPSDSADWSKPWSVSEAESFRLETRFDYDPLSAKMSRLTYWDGTAVRWSSSDDSHSDGLRFFRGNTSNSNFFNPVSGECNHPIGMLGMTHPLTFCGGDPSAPMVGRYVDNGGGSLQLENRFGDWSNKTFFGATAGAASGRLFVNGGDRAALTDDCFRDNRFPCNAASTIEDLQPGNQFARTLLATGDANTTGHFFLGDPAVGSRPDDAIPDRYVVWFGAQAKGVSNVLNALDRLSSELTSLPLDPVAGAFPAGRPLKVGASNFVMVLQRAPPAPTRFSVSPAATGIGGYAGGPATAPSAPALVWFDAKQRQLARVLSPDAGLTPAWNLEPVALDDGTVMTAYSVLDLRAGTANRVVARVGTEFQTVAQFAENQIFVTSETAFPEPFVIARRASALYVPFFGATSLSVGCARADGSAQSQAALPSEVTRVVWGPTDSPAAGALYLPVITTTGGAILEIDHGVADAQLCAAAPTVTTSVSALTDAPSTRLLSLRSGTLVYGTTGGKLMRFDPAAKTTSVVADLGSSVAGYLSELDDDHVAAIAFDVDATGHRNARMVQVDVTAGTVTSRDVHTLISPFELYPGVVPLD